MGTQLATGAYMPQVMQTQCTDPSECRGALLHVHDLLKRRCKFGLRATLAQVGTPIQS